MHNASTFDKDREKLAPIKEALHLCVQMLLQSMPRKADVLCVGAGTGAELIYLAKVFPEWRFTAIDPSESMIEICIKKVEKVGIANRCIFQQGYLNSLSDGPKFDVATSILVSHYIGGQKERIKYFSEIAAKISPNGCLVNADLSGDITSKNHQVLLDSWVAMHEFANMPANVEQLGKKDMLLTNREFESILLSSGFTNPVLFYKNLFIHGWFSKLR